MSERPVVDGRSREELLEELRDVAANYTEHWDPDTRDSGTALMEVVSRFETVLVERLDSVPQKHQIAFLDALDFSKRPPQSARVPLTFETTEGIDTNVVVEGGTQAMAEVGDEEVIFELPEDGGFEATPASLSAVFSVDPTTDRVFDHREDLESEDEDLATLFGGDDLQDHCFYLGHGDLLNLGAGSTVTIEVLTNASERVFNEAIEWEYYGVDPAAEDGDDEDAAGWHALPQETSETVDPEGDVSALMEAVGERVRELGGNTREDVDRPIELSFRVPAQITERAVDGTESRWLRATATGDEDRFFEMEIEAITVSVERGGEESGMEPDSVFQNDVPVDMDKDESGKDGGDVFPLGRFPQPPATMYVASEEAFTKGGSTVDVEFAPARGKDKREKVLVRGDTANGGEASGPVWFVEDLEDVNQIREGDIVVTDMTTTAMEPEIERAGAIVAEEGDLQSHAALVGQELDIPVIVGAEGAREELEEEETVTVDGDRGRVTVIEYLGERDEEEEPAEEVDAYDDDAYENRSSMLPGILGGPPELSWEYWNGEGWSRLKLLTDETDNLTDDGTVTFVVPEDLEETSVSGHDDYWIRARLISGNYGQLAYEMDQRGRQTEMEQRPEPPRFHDISIEYGQSRERFEDVITYNNVSYERVPDPEEGPHYFVPFERLSEDTQTLYLGFTDRLEEGPIKLHVPMRDDTYPRTFDPSVRWEVRPDPEDGDWQRLDAHDGTEGLTERGIVSLNFIEGTEPFSKFGETHHWIRARVTGDEFSRGPTGPAVRKEGERTVERNRQDRSRTREATTPPALEGIHPNTQWAHNDRTVEEEILGGSDGTHDQEFSCYNAPVTEIELWVDEVSMLTRREQRRLEDERPEAVEPVPATDDPVEFWVRWEEVEDFLDSDEDARHYRVDRTDGTVTFGDGQSGAIPPSGENNIQVTYKTGGGNEGNVDARAIEDLRTPISRIDEVTNLRQSDGGADAESLDTVVERAPRKIKNRDRAVTPRDYEQVAQASSRELAKTKCEPQMDDTGSRNPGYVTLLIVPRERRERPSPSTDLRRRVLEALRERAPTTIVGPEAQRIIVRGPNYAEVSVEATLRTRGVESVSNLKTTVEDELDDYFHPLTGNDDGEGWAFGESPRLSQVVSLIEGIEGVRRVPDAVMSVDTGGERIKIRDEAAAPDLSWEALVSTGSHEITVDMAGEHEATVKMTGETE